MTQNVFDYMTELVGRKRAAGKDSTADLYRVVRNRLSSFLGSGKLSFSGITTELVDEFADALRAEGLAVNTVNSYLSSFRAIYHTALREEEFKTLHDPFFRLHLRREETPKRALSTDTISSMMEMDLQEESAMQETLDLFLFSYLACGIPFVDLAYLKWENVVGDEIVYHRRKTGTLVRVGITGAMRLLMSRYSREGSRYLFPILHEGKDGYDAYKAALHTYNTMLKEIGERLALPAKLTSYVVRHTWATEALRQNTPVAVISQALGHTSEKTTRIYLAQLDQSVLNKANEMITKEICDRIMKRA